MKQVHILNGDALLDIFPSQLPGDRIVARECLVDGDVSGDTVEQLYATRASFINDNYTGHGGEYETKTVPEFEKIRNIPGDTEVALWFEDDLFCQVNLWFVLYLLGETDRDQRIYLVRPTTSLEFGFGGMSADALLKAFGNRVPICSEDFNELRKMWVHYQRNEFERLSQTAVRFAGKFPFLLPAVIAHKDRQDANGMGRPEKVLNEIIRELKTTDFGEVFREFTRREPIYGFGDLQVKRICKRLLNEQ